MSMLAALLGSGVGLGLVLIASGVRGTPPATDIVRLRTRIPIDRVLGVAAVAAVTFAVTGWPVLAALAACGTVAVPRVLSAGRRRAAAARSDAVAQWIEMLRTRSFDPLQAADQRERITPHPPWPTPGPHAPRTPRQ